MWQNIIGFVIFLAIVAGIGYFFYTRSLGFKEKIDGIIGKFKRE